MSGLPDLVNYDWPGNIRELEHVIERGIVLADDEILRRIYLPTRRPGSVTRNTGNGIVTKTIAENERDHILTTLKYCKGKIAGDAGAARVLGIPPSTLASKLKRLGIQKVHYVA